MRPKVTSAIPWTATSRGLSFRVSHPAIPGGQTSLGETPLRPPPGVQNPDQTRQGQHTGTSGGDWTDRATREGLAPGRSDPSAQPHHPGVGELLPYLREPSRLQPARSTHVGEAPPLGTPTTPHQICRMGPEAVLAPSGQPSH